MNTAVFAYSRRGCQTARRLMAALKEENLRAFTMERFQEPGFENLGKPAKDFYGAQFQWAQQMIFVSSCGLAVREIAPHVRDKRTDPAVLVVDELGRFVIPVLSGHIGGANAAAQALANALGATAVITTATDINGKFSVDTWATRNHCVIDSMHRAKEISAAVLEGEVPVFTEFPLISPWPSGITAGKEGTLGIYIGCERKEPFEKTLRLIPKILHLGIGCRKGTASDAIDRAVTQVFEKYNLDLRAVKEAASIDLKAQEQGLLQYCREKNWPVHFYTAEELAAVEGDFTPSAFVKKITGVENVCERSALMGADKLLVGKFACDGVTVAVAAEKWEVNFG